MLHIVRDLGQIPRTLMRRVAIKSMEKIEQSTEPPEVLCWYNEKGNKKGGTRRPKARIKRKKGESTLWVAARIC